MLNVHVVDDMFSSDNPVTATGGSTVLLGGSRFVNSQAPNVLSTSTTTTTTTTTTTNEQQQQQQDNVSTTKSVTSLNGTRRRGDWGMSAGTSHYAYTIVLIVYNI